MEPKIVGKNARYLIMQLTVNQCGAWRLVAMLWLAKKLDRPKQDLIMTAAILTIDMSLVDDEDSGEDVTDAANDPHAFLEIWYVFFYSFAKN